MFNLTISILLTELIEVVLQQTKLVSDLCYLDHCF